MRLDVVRRSVSQCEADVSAKLADVRYVEIDLSSGLITGIPLKSTLNDLLFELGDWRGTIIPIVGFGVRLLNSYTHTLRLLLLDN